ncbi:MAG: lactate utilization protein [Bacteroidetes bacterium]|nr:lactate utilization protein [Bacteroidota bacterium]
MRACLKRNTGKKVFNNSMYVCRETGLNEWLKKNHASKLASSNLLQYEQSAVTAHFSNSFLVDGVEEAEIILKGDFPHLNFNDAYAENEKASLTEHHTESISINDALFICADTGSVVLAGNNKNSLLNNHSKIQIVLATVDTILPSINDLDLMLPLTATFKNGEENFNCISIISSSRKENEPESAEEFYVLLLDNGRSDVITKENERQAVRCIKCGACHYACPVYETVGSKPFNHFLQWTNSLNDAAAHKCV